MIPLMKSAFLNELETKKAMSDFIMHASRLSMDVKCREFEMAFSKFQGRKHSVLFNSGASANLALLQALKNLNRLFQNDKIGFSAITWSTNVMPIIQMGFEAVPVDCQPETLNVMSTNLLDSLKQSKLKALFITNALGFTGDLHEIKKICDENDILLLEDNCESLGSELEGGKAGNFGLASTFSFFVAHHMSTIEGGMVCTDDDDLAEMLIITRANGWDRNLNFHEQRKWRSNFNIKSEFDAKYTFYDLAFNLRPTEITGFLGLYQMQFLDENISIRERNYHSFISIVENNQDLISFNLPYMRVISNFAFPVLCKTAQLKENYIKQFSGAGVEIRPVISGNIQRQPFYNKYIKTQYKLNGADFIHDNGFYFGNYPELTESDIDILSSCLMRYE